MLHCTSYFPLLLFFDAFRLHTAAVLNTSLKCIIFQLKEQKVVVDELSNLKKNRVWFQSRV